MATFTPLPLPAGYNRTSLNQQLQAMSARISGPAIVNPKDPPFGAVGDGIADDTVAIAAAIAALAATGGVVAFPPGVYMASQIVLYRNVILDGGTTAAVTLQQINGSNTDFIISENFAALTGTGETVGTSALVPSWFGLKDIFVHGNSTVASGTNTSGRGIAWYGTAQIMAGTVVVSYTAGDGIYTEGPTASFGSGLNASEESWFDHVIVKAPGGNGWLFHGPHDARVGTYICGMYQGIGWGWKNEDVTNAAGNLHMGCCHVYSYGANKNGIHMDASVTIGELVSDGVQCVIGSTVAVGIASVWSVVSSVTTLTVTGDYTAFGTLYVQALGSISNVIGCLWSAKHGRVGTGYFLDGTSGQSGNVALRNTGEDNQFDQLYIQSYSGTGSIGIDSAAGVVVGTRYTGTINNCKTAFKYDGGGHVHADLDIACNAGQVPVAGSVPATTDRFNIQSSGAVVGGTRVKAYGNAVINLNTLANQAVTFNHNCLYTPTAQDIVGMTISSFVIDYQWALIPIWWVATSTTITLSCTLALISSTAGAKASVTLDIRMGA